MSKNLRPRSWAFEFPLWLIRSLLYPSYLALNGLLCLYISTFEEKRTQSLSLTQKVLWTLIYGSILILLLPLTSIVFFMRCVLLLWRNPRAYLYSEKLSRYTREQTQQQNWRIDDLHDHTFTIATGNLCIMPEVLSKMNQLTDVDLRCEKMSERLSASQLFDEKWERRLEKTQNESRASKSKKSTPPSEAQEVKGGVATQFSRLDFVLIQEAWSSYHNKKLIAELHKTFPFVVHDVGVHNISTNMFCLNSGLLLASRHPILALDFKPFQAFCSHGVVFSQGLLMAKVLLGTPASRERKVGYLFNTHLQAFEGVNKVLVKQLGEVLAWTKEFQAVTREDNDNVLFNIVCGDLNLDSMSPCDQESSKHPLFTEYADFCKDAQGLEKPWTVGTEMRPRYLMENAIATPDGLKACMESPALRQRYLMDANLKEQSDTSISGSDVQTDEKGNVHLLPCGGRRRIDYILYHRDLPLTVESYNFVTQFAQLTDHVPVMMEFSCT